MRHLYISLVSLSLAGAASVLACGAGDDGSDDSASTGGKLDEAETEGAEDQQCSLEPSAPRQIAQFVLNDHIQFRCRGPQGTFVETTCCAPEINEFQLTTGCPLQAKFNDASGSDKRCVEDLPNDEIDEDGELFVPTSCCAPLCDQEAGWDDADVREVCRNSLGQFHPHVCCIMNDQNRCANAAYDAAPDANGFRLCRAQSGDFAGQFAEASCCMDKCFDIIADGEHVPLECLFPVEQECSDTNIDGNGICRHDDGRFAKGICCLGLENLDHGQSDDCYYAQLIDDDLQQAGCL